MKHGFYLFKETDAIFYWNGEIELVSHTTNFRWIKVPEWIESFNDGSIKHQFIYLGE